jgi:hypothetical protein
MVRLSRAFEERDVLDVLAADRREIRLTICTPRPIRQPGNRAQRLRLRSLRVDAANQIDQRMNADSRRAFRGPIAVELRIALPAGRDDAALSPVVKAHLDLLVGSVVDDDKFVDHLLVLRERIAGPGSEATIRCLPLSIFAAEFDRAFRVVGGAAAARLIKQRAPEPDPHEFMSPARRIWGLESFDEHAREILSYEESELAVIRDLDAQEEEQLATDPDADVELDVPTSAPEFADPDVRASTREHLERTVAFARGDLLTDQGFDARDRPGSPPAWLSETQALDAADVLELADGGPGCFLLPPPPDRPTSPGASRWQTQVAHTFGARRSTDGWHAVRFSGPLALDVAMRGRIDRGRDIDNVAAKIVSAFTGAFEDAEPDVVGYRVYRQPGDVDDVRVRVMPAVRLEALAASMNRAGAVLREQRAERMRD